MTRWLCGLALALSWLAVVETRAAAAELSTDKPAPSLAMVAWDGPAADLEALRGKTVVVLTYVTWCPKCNVWAPDMLKQVSKAAQDKPVALIAVATDVGAQEGRQFLLGKQFAGPNVFYGADPTLEASLGLDKTNLWNYAIIDASGKLATGGAAGSYYPGGKDGEKQYSAAYTLVQQKNLGTFQLLAPEMSDGLKQALWPLELGQAEIGQQLLKKIEKQAGSTDRELLKKSVDRFVQTEMEAVRKLVGGEVPDKLLALEKASVVATNFKATDAGNEAKKIVGDLTKDKTLKKEFGAKKLYEAALATPDPARRAIKLQATAKAFPGTYYAQQATKAATAAEK